MARSTEGNLNGLRASSSPSGCGVPPKCEATCFIHFNGDDPAQRHGTGHILVPRAAVLVALLGDGRDIVRKAILRLHVVERAGQRPFRARTVVSDTVYDQRIVALPNAQSPRRSCRSGRRRARENRRRPPACAHIISSRRSSIRSGRNFLGARRQLPRHAGITPSFFWFSKVRPAACPSRDRTCPCIDRPAERAGVAESDVVQEDEKDVGA